MLIRDNFERKKLLNSPVPPAAVVQVHWPSTQCKSAPVPHVVTEQSPTNVHVSA